MEHLTSVTEETEHELTAANTSTARTDAHDDAGQGEKIRVDRRKLELMLQGTLSVKLVIKHGYRLLFTYQVYICAS